MRIYFLTFGFFYLNFPYLTIQKETAIKRSSGKTAFFGFKTVTKNNLKSKNIFEKYPGRSTLLSYVSNFYTATLQNK